MLHRIFIALTSLVVGFSFSYTPVAAAAFTPSETDRIGQLRQEYAALDQTSFNSHNLYAVLPQFKDQFKAGKVVPNYLTAQLDYLNFYRGIFGLAPVSINEEDNQAAQKTAAVLAVLNANPLVNQHNLPHEKRPKLINKAIWHLAKVTSNQANLNFNTANQSAGAVITDLLTDRYNLSGADTGHRAWLLSTRLTATGFGAAYGKNGCRYSVQKVINPADTFHPASQEQVAYPSGDVFPLELLQNNKIAWSLYLSDRDFDSIPLITITDEDTNSTYQAKDVKNYSNASYGNFQTIITYSPNQTPLIAGHEYRIQVGDLATYRVKLFSLTK